MTPSSRGTKAMTTEISQEGSDDEECNVASRWSQPRRVARRVGLCLCLASTGYCGVIQWAPASLSEWFQFFPRAVASISGFLSSSFTSSGTRYPRALRKPAPASYKGHSPVFVSKHGNGPYRQGRTTHTCTAGHLDVPIPLLPHGTERRANRNFIARRLVHCGVRTSFEA